MDMYVFVISGGLVAYGARRKTHIINEDGECLCGCKIMGMPTLKVTRDWLDQPDYYGEMCKTCRKIANNKLKE